MSKKNYSVARVVTHTQSTIGKCERHNERKNESYANMNVDTARCDMNVHFKSCGELTYNEQLNMLIAEKKVCMRGLKADAKVFDEVIFDVNTDYFEKHGGYEYARDFYEEAYRFAVALYGEQNIISAVMHADELNVALTEQYGKPVYRYEIISGHRRFLAASRLEMTKILVVVLDITREEADIILVDSNLHREHILPSEKAFAYKMKMDALKKQGKRTDLTSDPVGPKLSSAEKISKDSEDSATQIKRYIRLTNLEKPLLNLVDEGRIAMRPAVELSYLTPEEQMMIFEAYESDEVTLSLAQAQKMRKLSEENQLNADTVLAILTAPKPN